MDSPAPRVCRAVPGGRPCRSLRKSGAGRTTRTPAKRDQQGAAELHVEPAAFVHPPAAGRRHSNEAGLPRTRLRQILYVVRQFSSPRSRDRLQVHTASKVAVQFATSENFAGLERREKRGPERDTAYGVTTVPALYGSAADLCRGPVGECSGRITIHATRGCRETASHHPVWLRQAECGSCCEPTTGRRSATRD
ncbi:MAG: hypothetical protein KatS3mg082_0017 [Nitrospiraceae bacterium]|nr:MAG: hypothetical protein KatS3mg082_0017 [Nitrospiraceae bacterium]